MTPTDLLHLLSQGEDSRHQFKRDATNADALAAELAAFANSGGGTLFLGVNDDGSVAGLDAVAVRRLNQLLSNTSSQHVRPPVHPLTENVRTADGIVMVVSVPDGLSKPYQDALGRLWVKQGADKRHDVLQRRRAGGSGRCWPGLEKGQHRLRSAAEPAQGFGRRHKVVHFLLREGVQRLAQAFLKDIGHLGEAAVHLTPPGLHLVMKHVALACVRRIVHDAVSWGTVCVAT